MSQLSALARALADCWPDADPTPPRDPPDLQRAAIAGEPLRVLEWLHLLRHKPALDVEFPAEAGDGAQAIWRAAVGIVALRRALLADIARGIRGGGGLCDSLAFVLAKGTAADPDGLLAALAALREEPAVLLDRLLVARRTPAQALQRLELPEDLPVLTALVSALPEALARHRGADRWLLDSLPASPLTTQDAVASILLTEKPPLSEELRWWLKCR